MTITLRQTKGSALTHAELDANFTTLETAITAGADGVTWVGQTNPVDNAWVSVVYGNQVFVAIASGAGSGNRIMTSSDGVNWTTRTNPEDNAWQDVTYGDGLFVAVSSDGTNRVMTSPDGITWTARAAAVANAWQAVTYGNGLFVAISNSGVGNRVMTSPDGITWTSRTSAADNSWTEVTYGNGLFVAVSGNGTNRVMTSPDGITWTARTAATARNWYSVAYGNGLFVAFSIDATVDSIMTSPDGITWTSGTISTGIRIYDVTWGNGFFVGVGQDLSGGGNNENIVTSPDGITWTIRSGMANISWFSVYYGNGLFVAVATTGTGNRVMTSGYQEVIPNDDVHRINGDLNINGNLDITGGKGHIITGASGATANTGADDFIVENNIAGGMSILVPDANLANFYLGTATNSDGAHLIWDYLGLEYIIGTNQGTAAIVLKSGSNVEAVRINSSQNVGIGIATPDGRCHVHTASAGAVSANASANDLIVENSTDAGISILSPDIATSYLVFGSPLSNLGARLSWAPAVLEFNVGTVTAGAHMRLISGAGVEAIYIDSSQNIGMGINTPDGRLHVHTASAGTVTAHAVADDLVVENSVNGGMSILVPDASQSSLYFGSPTANVGGELNWNYSTGLYKLATNKAGAEIILASGNNVEAIRIDGNQNVGIGAAPSLGKVHVYQGDSTVVTANAAADDFILESNVAVGMSLLTVDTSISYVIYGTASDPTGAYTSWDYTNDNFQIVTGKTGAKIEVKSGQSVLAMTIASDQGMYMTGATGGSQGSGTINAQAVYDDGVLLTCYVPHYIVDGTINLEEWDGYVPDKEDSKTSHKPAKRFLDDVENRIDVNNFSKFWKENKHLPTMPSKEEWVENGPKPTGEMIQMLWETVELQAAHIDQLLTRIEALEKAA